MLLMEPLLLISIIFHDLQHNLFCPTLGSLKNLLSIPNLLKFHNNEPISRYILTYCGGHLVCPFNMEMYFLHFWSILLNYFIDNFLPLTLSLKYIFSFSLFFLRPQHSMWRFPGQELNLSCSCNLCHSCSNARSFNLLHQAWDQTHTSVATGTTTVGFLTHCTTVGTPSLQYFQNSYYSATEIPDSLPNFFLFHF